METLKKQLMAFMNASFKTRTQAQVFVDALWEVKAEDPTKVNWALNEVLLWEIKSIETILVQSLKMGC